MNKWIEWAAIAAVLVLAIVVFIGAYSTWRQCMDAGGTTVRGLFWLECIQYRPTAKAGR